ncbi:MAG: cyclic pyranopterin monophosphate synthase MoaC [Flavobacteriales bacterium]|nr:cyclic pyranopterin monophosphate synthase MoaC [Flavobacteriales bacterium]
MANGDLTHLDESGNVRMVDVGQKDVSHRSAVAESFITLPSELLKQFSDGDLKTKKGSVIQTAIIAGIMAAKKTDQLIPLCHPLPLTKCNITIQAQTDGLHIACEVACSARTGVEMEALTGASVAALTVYDMCKSYGHEMEIRFCRLLTKSGGKSDYHRHETS